jgi:hypothetical protein
MWVPDQDKRIKVRMQSHGEDIETPWAEDLGEVDGRPGARRVRLGNVPYLYAKPTYGDVIIVAPDEQDGVLTWEDGAGDRPDIDEDGGRWAMIVEYRLAPGADDVDAAFRALDVAGEKADVMVEGAWTPRDGEPGRAYLAVPASMDVKAVLAKLKEAGVPLVFEVVHPVHDAQAPG